MQKKITFEGMPHSSPLEAHANAKLDKIFDMLADHENLQPLTIEVWLKAHKTHPHHIADIHLKTPQFSLHAQDEKTDMYVALDMAIDKIVEQLKKAKEKALDEEKKIENEKNKFTEELDKYTLSD